LLSYSIFHFTKEAISFWLPNLISRKAIFFFNILSNGDDKLAVEQQIIRYQINFG
jgi:hypothetical protein